MYLAKVAKRIADYTIVERNPPRPGKKLLVLDIDYTLFDHRSPAETGYELMRPFLHEFLTDAYEVLQYFKNFYNFNLIYRSFTSCLFFPFIFLFISRIMIL